MIGAINARAEAGGQNKEGEAQSYKIVYIDFTFIVLWDGVLRAAGQGNTGSERDAHSSLREFVLQVLK